MTSEEYDPADVIVYVPGLEGRRDPNPSWAWIVLAVIPLLVLLVGSRCG